MKERSADMERGEELEVEGRRLAWRRLGRGPRLLLLNGYAATSADWDPTFLEALGGSFELICPDNRGMGRSELGEGTVSVDGMARDCEALLDALGERRLPVVGWSMGGFIAQRLAVRSPGRVSGLGLISTDVGGPDGVAPAPEVWARLVDHTGTAREQASRLISLLFPPEVAADIDARFGQVVAAARIRLSPEALSAQEQAMDEWHREGSEPGGDPHLPVAVIHGSEDVVLRAANAEPLARRWPGARVELLAGCGHAVMAQEPDRVAAQIVAGLS